MWKFDNKMTGIYIGICLFSEEIGTGKPWPVAPFTNMV